MIIINNMEPSILSSSSSSINSRSTAIKTILLAAWRAKLSDEEWESRIRKILPRGVNGDVYDLADCLLKQALVGPIPNQLFISYLKHAVKCELVSHGAVLSSIAHQSTTHYNHNTNQQQQQQQSQQPQQMQNLSSQQQQQQTPSQQTSLNRTSPIICLLEFLKTFRNRISCKGTEIECLNLCRSINQLLHWLLKCILNSLEFILSSSSPYSNNNTIISGNTNLNINNPTTTNNSTSLANNLAGNMSVIPNLPNLPNLPANNPQMTQQTQFINLVHYESTIRIINLCTETIHYFIDRSFIKSLLFISKIEYSKKFDDIFKTIQLIQQRLSSDPNLQFIQDKIQYFSVLQQLVNTFNSRDMHPSVLAAQQLECQQKHKIITPTNAHCENNLTKQHSTPIIDNNPTTNNALFNSLYTLIACDAILRPARSHKLLARQIVLVTNFNSAPINMTYCEIIRVCKIGFIDSFGTPAKVKWAFFTFLKMPKLLIELSKISQQPTNFLENNNNLFLTPASTTTSGYSSQSSNFINDLNLAFERLCEYSPLLDEGEFKCNCDFFKCIVKELSKNDPSLTQDLRSIDFRKFSSKRVFNNNPENNNSGVGGNMLLKTEPVVTTILQTLDSSIDQNPTELFSIISQLVSGKQFEFTLSAAASTGRLQLFVKKLIDHNELNKVPNSENSTKSSLIFDITFLILAYVAQQYGADVIDYGNQEQLTSSTFKKWFYDCYNTSTRINCPKEILKNSNPEIVANLIKQILRSEEDGGGLHLKSVNWRDVCTNLPKAISDILEAWNQGVLNDNDLKVVFENIKSKMCCAAVITATWLQSYIKTLNETEKKKPLAFLQSLTKASSQAKLQKQVDSSTKDHYSERSSLMCSIIRKIYFELRSKPNSQSNSSSSAPSAQAMALNNSSASAMNSSIMNPINNDYNNTDDGSSLDETSHQSINDKFISTLTTQEIFLSNVKQCLTIGWIDHKSLVSANSLFKMIGSECFTNLIVEQILTSHDFRGDLSKAVNITYGLFHLDIEACAFALLKDTIPSWLMGEKKQTLLNQSRAFALAHLTVMTIIEAYSNLKASQSDAMRRNSNSSRSNELEKKNQLSLNGIKHESTTTTSNTINKQQQASINPMEVDKTTNNGASREIKRIKLSHQNQDTTTSGNIEKLIHSNNQELSDINDRLDKLHDCISDLMRLFKEIMSDGVKNHRTLFPVLFLQRTVVCTREGSTVITAHLQPEILLDIINLYSSELTFELVLAISNLSTTNSRKYAAKAMCQLARGFD